MGACASKAKEPQDDAQLVKLTPAANGTIPSKPGTAHSAGPQAASEPLQPPGSSAQPSSVRVDFDVSEEPLTGNSTVGNAYSQPTSSSQEAVKEGSLGPTGVYVPSSGFRTQKLAQVMAEKYDMPYEEVEKAIEFAESEDFVDIYCFTYCITGGPMEPTAFKVAGLQGMDKEAILQWATAAGNEDLRVLNAEEQRRHKKARDEFLVSQALQPEQAEEDEQPEDLEELTEAYRIRFDADTEHMSLEEVMEYFGVPEISKVAIHKHLHPARGSATATTDEIARRKAAHPIALERFDALS